MIGMNHLTNKLLKFYGVFTQYMFLVYYVMCFLLDEDGREYGIGFKTKIVLVFKMFRNIIKIPTASSPLEHLAMTTTILNIPKSIDGVIVECGSYKGGSTSNLSLVCSLVNRQLEVFDSFEGLPEPKNHDKDHILIDIQETHTYAKGAWRGGVEEVKQNIKRYGNIDICNFHVGYFNDTLPRVDKKVAFVFLDVDLRESLETCIKYFYPLLQDGCRIYTHEAHHMEIASLFFSDEWWQKNLGCTPPGLIGAGSGIGLSLLGGRSYFGSSLGYTIKNPQYFNFEKKPQKGC